MKRKILLMYNTVRYLRPIQIWHQVTRRIFRKNRASLIAKCKMEFPQTVSADYRIKIDELDSSNVFLKRYDAMDLEQGMVVILNENHQIDWETWNVEDASHLWNYNLHYLEFLIPLAVKYCQTNDEKDYLLWKKVWKSWNSSNSSDSYEPYTISLRIPNLLICMEFLRKRLNTDSEFKTELYNEIYHEYVYLLHNQELWLLGNHYFENLKTIAMCSLLFGEEKVWKRYYKKLCGQIREQILPDGVHYERSLMYHKIIMEDVMRLAVFLNGFRKQKEFLFLKSILQLMLNAIYSLENGMGHTPLFNDAGDNVAKSFSDLLIACRVIFQLEPVAKQNFADAGYYRMDNGSIALLFDCGQCGPSYMFGHAHCDTLSFELSVGGVPLFVNAGTGQYQGEHRNFFRSTEAHNTIMVAGRQQAELWGEHRAARRGKVMRCDTSDAMLEGSIFSFKGDYFKRRIKWNGQNELIVCDEVTMISKSKEGKKVSAFYRLSPLFHYEVREEGNKINILDEQRQTIAYIDLVEDYEFIIHRNDELSLYAEQFGKYDSCEVLEVCNIIEKNTQVNIKIFFKKKENEDE